MIGRPLALALTTLAATGRTSGAQAPADSLRRLDAGWANSYAVHDTAFAQALFADSIVVTGGSGQLKDKNGELADIRPTPGLKMSFFRTSDVTVRVHGAAAAVTGLAEWAFIYEGRPANNRRRYTATYVRGGPLGWRMVALHLGPAPQSR